MSEVEHGRGSQKQSSQKLIRSRHAIHLRKYKFSTDCAVIKIILFFAVFQILIIKIEF